MDQDNPADRLAKLNRVSIRAVLVAEGQDAATALVESGILDPVKVPFIPADESSSSGAVLGDGRTPNVVGILEPDNDDQFDPPPTFSQTASHQPDDANQQDGAPARETTTLPAAYGIKPLAPIRKRQR